jgi:hypothetical protein
MFTTLKSQGYYNTHLNVHHHLLPVFVPLNVVKACVHFVSDTDVGFIYGLY